jgi:4a-hydroxytetrahydrobiopterin dehydratase
MDEPHPGRTLRRQEASDAVSDLGWRYVLGTLRATVAVRSPAEAAEVAARAVAACHDEAASLSIDLRPDQVALSLQSPASASVTAREVALAQQVSEAVRRLGLATEARVGGPSRRSVQVVEIAIDALDIAAVRPFWKAVLGYTDEPGRSAPEDPLVDPLGQGPAIWFQQMDAPRPQRNRIHLDVSVPHDEAADRIRATLAAGGTLRYDAEAPAFWVLADPEHGHDQLGCHRVVAYFLGREPFGLQQCRQSAWIICSVSMAAGNVDQKVGTSLDQVGRKAGRLDRLRPPQNLPAVAELGRHLDALNRQAGRAEDGVQVCMVGPESAGCSLRLADKLPRLPAVALASCGDSSGQKEATPGRNMRRRGVEAGFHAARSRQRHLLGVNDSAGRQKGVGEPVGARCQKQRLADGPCHLNCPVGGDHGQAVVAELPQHG